MSIPNLKHRVRQKIGPAVARVERLHIVDWIVVVFLFCFSGSIPLWANPSTRPFPLPSHLFPANSNPFASKSNTSQIENASTPGLSIKLSYTNLQSTVSTTVLMVLSIVVPFVLITVLTIFILPIPPSRPSCSHHHHHLPLPAPVRRTSRTISAHFHSRLHRLNIYILGLLLSLALTLFVTESLKSLVGKQRPDFWGRCGGVVQDVELVKKYTVDDYGLGGSGIGGTRMVTWEVCRNYHTPEDENLTLDEKLEQSIGGDVVGGRVTRGELRDGWRSFPSGHASVSIAGLGYLAMFLGILVFDLGQGKWRRGRIGRKKSIVKLVVTAAPVLLAGYIGVTRYADMKHYGIDVLAGAVIGILALSVSWGWYSYEMFTDPPEVRCPRSDEDTVVVNDHEMEKEGDAATGQGRMEGMGGVGVFR